jgi:hypothetical protein
VLLLVVQLAASQRGGIHPSLFCLIGASARYIYLAFLLLLLLVSMSFVLFGAPQCIFAFCVVFFVCVRASAFARNL